jgi:hypothetical protein
VWDPWLVEYKVFDLYHCQTYYLRYWEGWGSFKNNQTGGAAVKLFGEHGEDLGSYPPSGDAYYQHNWDDVWRIKPC